MSKFADKEFWSKTIDKTIASTAQGLIVAMGAVVAGTAGLFDIDWVTAVSMGGGYGLASFLTSIAFRGTDDDTSADNLILPPTSDVSNGVIELEGNVDTDPEDEVISGEYSIEDTEVEALVDEDGELVVAVDLDGVDEDYQPKHGKLD